MQMSYNTFPKNPFPPNSEDYGGGGSSYELPIASAETLGGVKVGTGLSINSETGALSNSNPTPYSLPTASAETLGGVKVGTDLSISASGALSVLCSIPLFDKYKLSVNNENGFVIVKTHNGTETTTTYPSGVYQTYTVDDKFTVQYNDNWVITLLAASTEYDIGTTWSSGYGEQPAVSELDFVVGTRNGTASEFFTELFYS